ncbi:MAG TPA: phytase precursor [Sedimentibacter sp.]|nr:phytase precursor [Sedimentibacter sp.]
MLFSACNDKTSKVDKHNQNNKSKSILPEVAVIKESFTTPRDESDNVDSPALWHGGEGQNWLLATAKEGNAIIVYDAANGEKIGRFGSIGTGLGELSRPNGIAVIDDYAVVIERDNHRVQVFILPEFKPLGVFGESVLRSPYGITIDRFEGKYHLYVTDNYETPEEETPPADSLDRRVHHFAFTVEDNRVAAEHIKAFGDTSGEGVLYKVESILADRIYNRLLIADEHEDHRDIKIYDTDGRFTGQIIPHNYFFYEPEGIVVWECEADSSGYYLIVDQGKINNTFQVFDRKTLEYIGGFSGEITRNTDGTAITQKAFGDFRYGAFYPVHNDGSLTAISWQDIAGTLGLRNDCD